MTRVIGALLLALGLLSIQAVAQAQPPPPLFLQGPVVAFGTAALDRIVLYDVGVEGGARRELSFGSGWHYVWGFSPDGCRLLYTLSDGINPARLYSARLDGTDPREMVAYSGSEWWGVWEPVWSSGDLIAFTMQRYTLEADGTLERQYHTAWVDAAAVMQQGAPAEAQFYSRTGDEHNPQWSPDGRWLAYISFERRWPGADSSSTAEPTPLPPPGTTPPPFNAELLLREADLWVVSADGQTKYRLTYFDTGSVRAPRWSPDSQLIGFTYAPSANNDQFWLIANQAGAIPTQLSRVWSLVLDTTWLPDSSAMLAAVRDFRDTQANRLWLIPLVGLAEDSATLYLGGTQIPLEYADYPRFSADGRWLALRSAYSLQVIDTQTLAWVDADAGQPGNTPPVWTPAGFGGETACLAR
ncbi:MAG: PD40 domain-containing protein [Chloroflexi bacterium]|nr:PD40 domain-containing protein [Chloroflexota bacterium]